MTIETYKTVPVDFLFTTRPKGSFEKSTVKSDLFDLWVTLGTEMGTSNRGVAGSVIWDGGQRNKLVTAVEGFARGRVEFSSDARDQSEFTPNCPSN